MTSPASFKIDSPTPEQAGADAKKYLAFMEPSLRFGGLEFELDYFKEMVTAGAFLIVRVWDGSELISVSALEVRELVDGLDLYVVATASIRDIDKWIGDFDAVLGQVAAEAQCKTITVLTRNGMGKIAKQYGYRVHQVTIRKRVKKWAVH